MEIQVGNGIRVQIPAVALLFNRRKTKMISIHVPFGGNPPNLNKEIMSAKNIKNKQIRDNTLTGLNKINHYF